MLPAVAHILLATDSDAVAEDVFAALAGAGTTVSRVRKGADVRPVVAELAPELVILDLQIGNMGGLATSLDLRLEAEMQRIPETRILLLLDREADRWLASEAKADGELVKPIDAFRLRRAATALLADPVP
jgi:DNA-binding response OmpR family regulator